MNNQEASRVSDDEFSACREKYTRECTEEKEIEMIHETDAMCNGRTATRLNMRQYRRESETRESAREPDYINTIAEENSK